MNHLSFNNDFYNYQQKKVLACFRNIGISEFLCTCNYNITRGLILVEISMLYIYWYFHLRSYCGKGFSTKYPHTSCLKSLIPNWDSFKVVKKLIYQIFCVSCYSSSSLKLSDEWPVFKSFFRSPHKFQIVSEVWTQFDCTSWEVWNKQWYD